MCFVFFSLLFALCLLFRYWSACTNFPPHVMRSLSLWLMIWVIWAWAVVLNSSECWEKQREKGRWIVLDTEKAEHRPLTACGAGKRQRSLDQRVWSDPRFVWLDPRFIIIPEAKNFWVYRKKASSMLSHMFFIRPSFSPSLPPREGRSGAQSIWLIAGSKHVREREREIRKEMESFKAIGFLANFSIFDTYPCSLIPLSLSSVSTVW